MAAPPRPVVQPFLIHVYRNGDVTDKGQAILFDRKRHPNWAHFLDMVTSKVGTSNSLPVTKLYSIDGSPITQFNHLLPKERYVASDRRHEFERVHYGGARASRGWTNGRVRFDKSADADQRNIRSYGDFMKRRTASTPRRSQTQPKIKHNDILQESGRGSIMSELASLAMTSRHDTEETADELDRSGPPV